jgi:type I protein arginine methyltransferase
MCSYFERLYKPPMTNTTQGYSLSGYGDMIVDNRIKPYVQALKAAVKPGSVVLDIGTGTGFFAILACQFGAKRVYAIEPDDAIIMARQVAIDNGYADRIEFIQAISTQVNLPEKVDVIISDLRGGVPLFQHHIGSISDARHRFLAPEGIQIPQQDTLWLTLISDAEGYRKKYESPWCDNPYGCDLTANHKFVTNTWTKKRLQPEQLVVEPQIWTTLDYTTIINPNVKNTLTWSIAASSTIHGLGLWFDTVLAEEIGFSNAPDRLPYIYSNVFFPLSHPVDVVPGDRVTVTLQAKLIGDDYVWNWYTQVTTDDIPAQIKANFQQSTLLGMPLSPQALQKRADTYIPHLSESARIDNLILNLMAEMKPLGDIAYHLAQEFPQQFNTWQKALSYVGELSQRYCE